LGWAIELLSAVVVTQWLTWDGSDSETDAAASGEETSPLPAPEQNSSIRPMTFQERIAMERQRNDREPSLS